MSRPIPQGAAEFGWADLHRSVELTGEITGVVETRLVGFLGRAEGGGPEKVGGDTHAHQVAPEADLAGLVELTLELADRHPGQLGHLGDVQGGVEVVPDELCRGIDLQDWLQQGSKLGGTPLVPSVRISVFGT